MKTQGSSREERDDERCRKGDGDTDALGERLGDGKGQSERC